jgi:3-dehydroquinate synthase
VIQVDITLPHNNSYKISIGNLEHINLSGRKVGIVTNPKVAGLHLKYLLNNITADEIYIITVPDGENYKNMATIETILESCFNHKFDRNSLLVAFGGGVIGDMTGFAASIYQRGIDFIQVPTTLLSQVDASVGGKTGVNNKFGKNLVGAFYQPKAVYIDTHFLQTLPKREFGAGVAEIIKMAVTFDKSFFEFLSKVDLHDDNELKVAIERSVHLKAHVVSQDEKERGLRAALNYGHTFGHVIENETGYTTYLHGETVGIGMVMANMLAQKLELMTNAEEERVLRLLQKYNIPTSYKIKDVEQFYDKFFLDKKALNSKLKFILPVGIGHCKITDEVQKEDLIAILNEFSV